MPPERNRTSQRFTPTLGRHSLTSITELVERNGGDDVIPRIVEPPRDSPPPMDGYEEYETVELPDVPTRDPSDVSLDTNTTAAVSK